MGSHSPFKPNHHPAFAGWVPTITGQLSFSLIGLGGAAPGCVTANVEFRDEAVGHPRRRVAVVQRRVTRDLPYTGWPIPQLAPSIAADFVLVGETRAAARPVLRDCIVSPRDDEIGVLVGDVIVVPNQADYPSAERALLQKIRSRVAVVGDSTPRAMVGDDAGLDKDAEAWISEAARNKLTLARARFELYRTGEVRLELTETIPVDPNGGYEQAEFDTILASQIYYFIKDASHRHYHHRRASDNLLPLTQISADDDVSWRRETLWSLARSVLEMRRSGKLPGHKSALGILAYAEAFQGLLARVVRSTKSEGVFEATDEVACYDFTHTRQSLEATIAEKSFLQSHWSGIYSFLIATTLAFAALWIATAQIQQQACFGGDCPTIPTPIKWTLWWVLEEPQLAAGVLVTLAAVYLETTRRSLMTVTPLRVWGEFIASWFDALGATVSRWARKNHPVWGDRIGATIAWTYSLFFVISGLHLLGAFTQLWSFNPWLTGVWGASVAGLVVGPIITRKLQA